MKNGRNYPLLLTGQFLGAFGDQFLFAAILAPLTHLVKTGAITAGAVSSANSLFNLVFAVPFLALAPLAGFLNDRMPKTSWLLGGNLVKIMGALVGLAGVLTFHANPEAMKWWQVAGYTIVGLGACLYSPAKYGILPEIVATDRLVRANGAVEMLTLIAILGGFAAGGMLYDYTLSLPGCYVAAIACYGLAAWANGVMDRTPNNPAATLGESWSSFRRHLVTLFAARRTGRILLGCGLFWLAGAFLKNNLQAWGVAALQAAGFEVDAIDNTKLALLKASPILAIAAGSILAGRIHRLGDLSKQWIYALGLAVGVTILGWMKGGEGLAMVVAALCFVGIVSGLLIVPLNASLQHETDQKALGKTIAVQNVVDYAGIMLGAGLLGLLTSPDWAGLTPHQAFYGLAIVVVLMTLGMKLSAKPGDRVPAVAGK